MNFSAVASEPSAISHIAFHFVLTVSVVRGPNGGQQNAEEKQTHQWMRFESFNSRKNVETNTEIESALRSDFGR